MRHKADTDFGHITDKYFLTSKIKSYCINAVLVRQNLEESPVVQLSPLLFFFSSTSLHWFTKGLIDREHKIHMYVF